MKIQGCDVMSEEKGRVDLEKIEAKKFLFGNDILKVWLEELILFGW